ncbi:MAG TPA: OmpA family protein [Ghiorsea sp.]|nr:OmpA family protein [Ghiorsea sp.]HIP07287.1 OmpA family protein [Mariprofundaceae bacterium]
MSANSNQNNEAAMQELRKLLFEKESVRLDELELLLRDQKLHAQEVAKVLAEAVKIRNQKDDELGKSLAPTIEKSIKESIAKDPKSLSDALFPVMGPAIRKSINNSIAEMLQSLNQTLENSFSVQGMKWRFEAMRTSKSFAEVVMLNTLVYRVEQVFLIHKETGLLLHHLSFDPALNEDADVVSSMLTAVQDFIQDSFAGSTDQGIENLRMGDLEVIIETGPDVVLAVVCRGTTPRSFNEKIQETVENIQQLYTVEFKEFEGETEPFQSMNEHLQPLLVSDFKGNAESDKKGSPIKAIIAVVLLVFIIIGWWAFGEIEDNQKQDQWHNYLQKIHNEPGIIITNIQQLDGKSIISGLRDPLSTDPYTLLSGFGLDGSNVIFHMQPYHALQEPLVLKRVAQLILPPKSIQITMNNGTLTISGVASEIWLSQAEQAALYIAGVDNIDSSQVSILTSVFKDFPHDRPIKLDALPSKPKKAIIRNKKPQKHVVTDEAILKRIIALLKPPATVQLVYSKGTLYVSGKASESWIEFAKNNFSRVEEVDSFHTSNLSSKGMQ